MNSESPKMHFILFKRRGEFELAACRGQYKGCNVQLKQRQKMGPCEHCIICEDENETIGQIYDRLQKGDA